MGRADGQDGKEAQEVAGEVWERQPGETEAQYRAFAHYRDSPPAARSLRKTAKAVKCSESGIFKWSSKYGWEQRIRSFDGELERVRLAELRDEQIAAGKRHAQTVQVHLLGLGKLSAELLRRINADEKFLERLPDKSLIQMATGAARATPRLIVAERLALGLSSENVGGHDGGPIEGGAAKDMSDAELDAFLMGAEAAAKNIA